MNILLDRRHGRGILPRLRFPHRLWLAASIVAGLSLSIGARDADAATRIWTGTNSGLWSDAGNWGGTAPVAGDDLVFPTGAQHTTNTNDLPAGTLFNSITIQQPYIITGNAIVLDAGGLVKTVQGGLVTFGLSTTLAVDQTWSSAIGSSVTISGAIHLNGRTLTLNSGGIMEVSGVIDGSGALVKTGDQGLTLSGANTYAGPTTVAAWVLTAASPTALGVADGTAQNGTTVVKDATLQLLGVALGNEAVVLEGFGGGINGGALSINGGPSSLAGPVTLAGDTGVALLNAFPLTLSGVVSGPGQLGLAWDGSLVLTNGGNNFTGGVNMHDAVGPRSASLVVGADHAIPGAPIIDLAAGNTLAINGHAQTLAGVTGSGKLNIGAAPAVLTLNGTGDTSFAGVASGSGVIDHTGTGHQTFSGANTFSGPLLVDHGIVTVSAGTLPATVTVNNDGRFSLTANGTTGAITVNSGHLQLTEGGAATGNSSTLTLNGAATLDVGGTGPAALGSLKVAGGVTLGGATLAVQLPPTFSPGPAATFTLIDNDGVDPINGTFAGLPEGASLAVGGVVFRISYVGGNGNDVVLTGGGALTYLLSEGATGGFFTTDLLLANPNNQTVPIDITFLKDDGTTVAMDDTLPPLSHKLIRVNNVAGMEATSFSTVVRSSDSFPLAVERTMSWDQRGYGAHTEHATQGAATTWYFAEGSQGFFHTYLLLANPQSSANTATVQYLRETEAPLTRTYQLAATSRLTVDAGTDAELVGRSFGMIVTFAQPGAAERAMYFGESPLFNGGHESAGVEAPAQTWFLAEGATGPFFETFILLANPNDVDATATMTYLPAAGAPVTTIKTLPARARLTINLENEAPSLANAAVSTQVAATQPILVERSQYWPDPAPNWYEAHNSFGVTALGTRWALAEGRVGGSNGAQTYVLLANPGTTVANVTITFLRDNGAPTVTKTFAVPPASRFNVPVGPGTSVPELTNENFGALVTSDQPIAVERALYWDANGQIWAAGTDATATRLP